ncbi:MAG TPA: carbohydrate ABC transporter substrate-binding protein [Clostridiaceae bacterium]|nr:carbohydrate ABC transporter substrate-binding protein [Clostridiaceae bacterium]
MKRVISILLVVVMLLSFAGCGKKETPGGTDDKASTGTSTDSTSQKKVEEVYFFSSIGAYKTLLEQEIEKWNNGEGAQKGVRIVMETNIDNYGTALETMIQAGTYPDLADMYARVDMLKAGYARNLYEIKEIQDLVERFKPYLSQGINLQGDKLYSLPLELVPLKMVYNAEIFKECGLTEPPKTWDEMADYAKIITEKGNGKYYGFGWTTMWTASFQRLAMKATISSTGVGWFNNNTGTYDFKPFEKVIKAIARMYQEGSMFPTPLDQHIDPIRNRFAEGLVGMEIAPSYDVSVYTSQFPAKFDWRVCEVPAITEEGLIYNGIALNRGNISITKWVEESRLPAVIEAFRFMHSKELYKKLYSNSAIIPHEMELIEEVKKAGFEYEMPNWSVMSDITYYVGEPVRPDRLLTLDGDNYHTVFTNIMLGETTWEAEIDALNKRYNDAYKKAKDQGLIDVSIYEAPWDPGKRK